MIQSTLDCPKCHSTMERGYTLDQSHAAIFTGQWVQGTPKRSLMDLFGGFLIKSPNRKNRIPFGAYRCQSCGFLEFYAREEFRPKW